mgnify:CR=1 FL=1
MVKHEIKVELSDSATIQTLIEKSYFEEGFKGKILGKKNFLTIDESDEINHTIFKGLNNATVKIINEIIEPYTPNALLQRTWECLESKPVIASAVSNAVVMKRASLVCSSPSA